MILLSFDIEEFDMPLEYKGEISFAEQISVSRNGLQYILKILKKYNIKATFFSTVIFAENNKDLISELLTDGHELASHTWFHSDFQESHLLDSRRKLEELFKTKVVGLRMPRMMTVSGEAVADAGYFYNSSINPTFLPGRYNNLKVSKTVFLQNSVLQFPASVSPTFRIPLFWLSFHNFPLWLYQFLSKRCLKSTGYLNIYFHPWEFANISNLKYKLPKFTINNTGEKMAYRFEKFILWAIENNYKFDTIKSFVKQFEK